MTETSAHKNEMGIAAILGVLIGLVAVALGFFSMFNTAMGWHAGLRVYGTSTPLPDTWDAAIGLTLAGVLIAAMSWSASWLWRRVRGTSSIASKIAISAMALLTCALMGWSIRYLALINTYGSMLAYYCTDGSLENVRAELANHPQQTALREALFRAAQYNNLDALRLLLAADADPRPEADHLMDFSREGFAFTEQLLAAGRLAAHDFTDQAQMWRAVRGAGEDQDTARMVCHLQRLGFSADVVPRGQSETVLQIAQRRRLTQTIRALHGDCPN